MTLDRMHVPGTLAPVTTNEVAHCQLCGVQWQVQSTIREDAMGCAFCGAPESAITIESEAPDYSGVKWANGRRGNAW